MTDHGYIRALERGVSEDEIARIVNSPVETIYDNYEENYKSYGIVIDKYNKDKKMYIMIVHDNLNHNPVNIITVMVTSKGGLKAIGFSNV